MSTKFRSSVVQGLCVLTLCLPISLWADIRVEIRAFPVFPVALVYLATHEYVTCRLPMECYAGSRAKQPASPLRLPGTPPRS